MRKSTEEYYGARAEAARRMAARATDAGVRNVHLKLAAQYDAMVRGERPAGPERDGQPGDETASH